MSAKVARSERILSQIAAKTGVSEAGKAWLMTALDPFHDNPYKVEGYPDLTSDASVVQCIKQSVQVTCPSTITSGTWDCHFTSYPFLEPINCVQGGSSGTRNQLGVPGVTPTVPLGGIGIFSTYTNATGIFGNAADGLHVYNNLSLPTTYTNGPCRVIASGFEVTNTTSPLNVQGLVTTWRSPTSDFKQKSIMGNLFEDSVPHLYVAPGPCWITTAPPINIAQALLLDGSKQWEAKEGCYVVSTFSDMTNDPQYELGITPVLINPGFTFSNTSSFTPALIGAGALQAAAYNSNYTYTPGVQVPDVNFYTPMNYAGAIFTGLSLTTTLTLTWHCYVERFPGFESPDLIVLATPSPQYDPQALELYAAIQSHLPTGVKVSENGLGDWFAAAVNVAKNVVAPALSAMPFPAAQAIGRSITAANGIYNAIKSRSGNTEKPSKTVNMGPPRLGPAKKKKKKPAKKKS